MKQLSFSLVIVFVLAVPTIGYCQFNWGALNHTINQLNDAVVTNQALSNQRQAIENQRQYLNQQAEALRQQNEIARQQLELQRQALGVQLPQQQRQSEYLSGLSPRDALELRELAQKCDKKSIDAINAVAATVSNKKETSHMLSYNWSGEWEGKQEDHKIVTVTSLVVVDRCMTGKSRMINIYRGNNLVAYYDPSHDIVKLVK